MTEKLIKEWKADPAGEMIVRVYQEEGFVRAVKAFFCQPSREVDVPSGVCSGLYEPVPLTLGANQRVEVSDRGKVIINE